MNSEIQAFVVASRMKRLPEGSKAKTGTQTILPCTVPREQQSLARQEEGATHRRQSSSQCLEAGRMYCGVQGVIHTVGAMSCPKRSVATLFGLASDLQNVRDTSTFSRHDVTRVHQKLPGWTRTWRER